jgi:hypothetical protein
MLRPEVRASKDLAPPFHDFSRTPLTTALHGSPSRLRFINVPFRPFRFRASFLPSGRYGYWLLSRPSPPHLPRRDPP